MKIGFESRKWQKTIKILLTTEYPEFCTAVSKARRLISQLFLLCFAVSVTLKAQRITKVILDRHFLIQFAEMATR